MRPPPGPPTPTLPNDACPAPMTDRLRYAIRLRRFATALLLLMAGLLLFSTWARLRLHPEFVWLQSFAEAALVGGLADWFAVTALFRHPMGIPIPHTAIIARSKDRIGDALADFLKDNFLTPANVARRLQSFDAVDAVARMLERPVAAGRIRAGLMRLLTELSQTAAAQSVYARLRNATTERLRDIDISPLLGQVLNAILARGEHRAAIDQMIAWAERTLAREEKLIHGMVEERTNWLLRLINVDEKIADELVAGLRQLLSDLAADPNHPVRARAEAALHTLAQELQHRPQTRARVEEIKREMLANPAVRRWLDGIWAELRDSLEGLQQGDFWRSIGGSVAASLRADPGIARSINLLLRRAVIATVSDYGAAIVTLVSETIRRWDAATVTGKIEDAVLRDLQYIRLNGTLIGGLIGVSIHAVLLLAPAA